MADLFPFRPLQRRQTVDSPLRKGCATTAPNVSCSLEDGQGTYNFLKAETVQQTGVHQIGKSNYLPLRQTLKIFAHFKNWSDSSLELEAGPNFQSSSQPEPNCLKIRLSLR
ncbi:uncharacterized protein RBU33_019053 isoform 1-T1 [Hipposideros larvatus]